MRFAKRQVRRLVWTAVGVLAAGWLYSGGASTLADKIGATEVVDKVGQLGGKNSAGNTAAKAATATIVRVIDGDTIEVRFPNGSEADTRLIGFDTPESVKPDLPAAECGGLEASAFTKQVAEGKAVRLVVDPSQDKVDRYGRLLRYARIDGQDLGRIVIAAGWGAPYIYNESNPPKQTDSYRKAAAAAREKQKGVWSLCEGNFHSANDQPWSGD